MSRSVVVYLLQNKAVADTLKVQRKKFVKTKVYGELESVSGDEYFRAGQLGIKAKYMVSVFLYDYHDEQLCELQGKRYLIYRTYNRKGTERIELYLAEEIQHEDES